MMKPWLVCLVLIQLAGGAFAATVRDLRCERLKDLLGIDAPQPCLSWTIASAELQIMNRS